LVKRSLARAIAAFVEDDLRRLFEGYVEAKQSQHVLDYDDLLLYWAELMKEPQLADAVRGLFDHVVVDEYQDTNAIQAAILLALKPDAAAPIGVAAVDLLDRMRGRGARQAEAKLRIDHRLLLRGGAQIED
jgi:superfamily I DNA/RNA helicase